MGVIAIITCVFHLRIITSDEKPPTGKKSLALADKCCYNVDVAASLLAGIRYSNPFFYSNTWDEGHCQSAVSLVFTGVAPVIQRFLLKKPENMIYLP